MACTVLATRSRSSKGIDSSSSRPASIFEKSRISFNRPWSDSVDWSINRMNSRCLDVRSVFSINWVMPVIPLMGVRIS